MVGLKGLPVSYGGVETHVSELAPRLALSQLTNPSTVFLAVALTLLVVWRRDSRLAMRWAVTLSVLAVAYLPWVLDWYDRIGGDRLFLDRPRAGGVKLRQAPFSLVNVPYVYWVFSFGYSLGPSLHELHLDRSARGILRHWPALVAGAFAIGTAVVRGVREVRRRRDLFLFSVLLLVPLGMLIVLTLRDLKAFNVRYIMVSYPPFLTLLALGWSRPGRLRNASALVAAAVTIYALGNHYFVERYAKEDVRAAAELVLERDEPDDGVVVIDNAQTFRWYYAHRGGGTAPILNRHKRDLRTDAQIRAHFREAMPPGGRLWVVLSRWWEVAPRSRLYRILDAELVRTARWELHDVEVALYERPADRDDD
jgi:hypothetical protein